MNDEGTPMKFQIVLQCPASTIKDYDEMIWLEEALIEGIVTIALVDGHDAGSGEVNIFLLTNDPYRAFKQIKRVLGSKDFMIGLKAAFRERTQSDY
jgi:hypothetical protein